MWIVKLFNASRNKSQSIFEYILVTVVFVTAGIATFFATIQNTAINRAGTNSTFHLNETDMGKIISKRGINQSELIWPSKFKEYSQYAEGYSGTINEDQIVVLNSTSNCSKNSKPLTELMYQYEPLNYSETPQIYEEDLKFNEELYKKYNIKK